MRWSGMALHFLHASPAAAVAFYDPRLGAVVVASHSREWQVRQVVDVTLPAEI
jgi:CRISPR-associated protein Csx3